MKAGDQRKPKEVCSLMFWIQRATDGGWDYADDGGNDHRILFGVERSNGAGTRCQFLSLIAGIWRVTFGWMKKE